MLGGGCDTSIGSSLRLIVRALINIYIFFQYCDCTMSGPIVYRQHESGSRHNEVGSSTSSCKQQITAVMCRKYSIQIVLLTLMLLVTYFACSQYKIMKKPEKLLKPWHIMGTHQSALQGGLSQQSVWVRFWTHKPLKRTLRTPKFYCVEFLKISIL